MVSIIEIKKANTRLKEVNTRIKEEQEDSYESYIFGQELTEESVANELEQRVNIEEFREEQEQGSFCEIDPRANFYTSGNNEQSPEDEQDSEYVPANRHFLIENSERGLSVFEQELKKQIEKDSQISQTEKEQGRLENSKTRINMSQLPKMLGRRLNEQIWSSFPKELSEKRKQGNKKVIKQIWSKLKKYDEYFKNGFYRESPQKQEEEIYFRIGEIGLELKKGTFLPSEYQHIWDFSRRFIQRKADPFLSNEGGVVISDKEIAIDTLERYAGKVCMAMQYIRELPEDKRKANLDLIYNELKNIKRRFELPKGVRGILYRRYQRRLNTIIAKGFEN